MGLRFESIPVDYFIVFSELEAQLANEFDFELEAQAMTRISDFLRDVALTRGDPAPVVVTPRPVEGLVSRRVLVMDFLMGVPLSRALEEAKQRGVDPKGPESQLFGRKLLRGLTDAFGLSILGDG